MSRRYLDDAKSTLATSITAVSTTLTVATGHGVRFPTIVGKGTPGAALDFFVVTLKDASGNKEKVKVEEHVAASDALGTVGFPLVRGFDGTTARAFASGDLIVLPWERVAAQNAEDFGVAYKDFSYNDATTSGLTFGFYGGNVFTNGAITTTANGTLSLTLSATNFIERTEAGAVSFNTTAFTAGRIAMYQVTTSATQITAITDKRVNTHHVDVIWDMPPALIAQVYTR